MQRRQSDHFDYFYDVLSLDLAKITPAARAACVAAYASDSALTAGFNWYRAFPHDADENKRASEQPQVATPLLYLRGEHQRGDIHAYVQGFRAAGVTQIEHAVPGAGHFAQEEAPDGVWRLIADFARS